MSREVALSEPLVLHLLVERPDVGGVTGLAPLVALRLDVAGPITYLDWSDGVWRTTAWALRLGSLLEVDPLLAPGIYRLALQNWPPGTAPGDRIIAEYAVDDGAQVRRAVESYVARDTVEQLAWVHAVHHNRQEAVPGTPGALTVYRGDGVTPWKTAELRDYVGAGVAGASGIPAKRGGFG